MSAVTRLKYALPFAACLAGCGGKSRSYVEANLEVPSASGGSGANGGAPSAGAGGGEPGNGATGGAGKTAGNRSASPECSAGATTSDTGGGADFDLSGFPACGKLDPTLDCAGLTNIGLAEPGVGAFRDGSLQRGGGGTVSVWVENCDVVQHNDLCVGLAVNLPDISITTNGPEAPSGEPLADPVPIGGVEAGHGAHVTPFDIRVPATEEIGVTATFTFWVGRVGTRCVGTTVSVDTQIEPMPGI